jgi:hypothetical protein
MEQELIKYKDAEKVLNDNNFFASKVSGKRGIRLTHTFWSISWYAVEYKVITIKVNGTWVVISITMNNKELEGWDEFISSIKDIRKLQHEFRQKLFKKA